MRLLFVYIIFMYVEIEHVKRIYLYLGKQSPWLNMSFKLRTPRKVWLFTYICDQTSGWQMKCPMVLSQSEDRNFSLPWSFQRATGPTSILSDGNGGFSIPRDKLAIVWVCSLTSNTVSSSIITQIRHLLSWHSGGQLYFDCFIFRSECSVDM